MQRGRRPVIVHIRQCHTEYRVTHKAIGFQDDVSLLSDEMENHSVSLTPSLLFHILGALGDKPL